VRHLPTSPNPAWRRTIAAGLGVVVLAGCHKPGALATPASQTSNGSVANASPAAAPPQASAGAPAQRDSITDLADQGRIMGSASAPVWIVEASDFQCPFCKAFHDQTFPSLLRDYVNTNKVRIAFLNFPLSMHRNSHQAAEAAMCAAVQQRFWPMHDALFATQDRWGDLPDPTPVYDSLARAVGVNEPDWKHCVTTHATLSLVQADYQRAQQSGVQSTPTFFIGSSVIEGAQPYTEFRDTIESVLRRTAAAPPAHKR
jgi:protein-disulfide isomerase